jgi:hypothetical protein
MPGKLPPYSELPPFFDRIPSSILCRAIAKPRYNPAGLSIENIRSAALEEDAGRYPAFFADRIFYECIAFDTQFDCSAWIVIDGDNAALRLGMPNDLGFSPNVFGPPASGVKTETCDEQHCHNHAANSA